MTVQNFNSLYEFGPKKSTNQIFDGPSFYEPKLSLPKKPGEINAFLPIHELGPFSSSFMR